MLSENFATLRELHADPPLIDDAERLARPCSPVAGTSCCRRARAGLVRDGHGDLRAEHVVLERGIEIVDCVEFDPALREIDVGLDLAFLVMDLLRRDERLAAALVSAYREAGGDPGDDALVTFFAAQRALIRAKVALVRAGQVESADAARRRADAAVAARARGAARVARAARAGSGRVRAGRERQVDARGDARRAGWGARAVVRPRPQGAAGVWRRRRGRPRAPTSRRSTGGPTRRSGSGHAR